mmetsp:Transcript_32582/g.62940  ORF Transcript_32582/g.62940 Transcript_32582/m.62940 type:complete len:118 (-) Transcript_32582:177-530(-)
MVAWRSSEGVGQETQAEHTHLPSAIIGFSSASGAHDFSKANTLTYTTSTKPCRLDCLPGWKCCAGACCLESYECCGADDAMKCCGAGMICSNVGCTTKAVAAGQVMAMNLGAILLLG